MVRARQVRHIRSILGLSRVSKVSSADLDALVVAQKSAFAAQMGIRRLTHHLRSFSKVWTPRDRVSESLHRVDPEGVEDRRTRKLKRRIFHSQGPNEVWSLDGHDKLKRYGFCIHGCVDVYSRFLIWLRVAVSNNDPDIILTYFFDAIVSLATDQSGISPTFPNPTTSG
jgi:transposase InsO family protein